MPGGTTGERLLTGEATVALVGQPNVGKSALFHQLTGRYVSVSNYAGTTVDLVHGPARLLPGTDFVDTPGLVGLPSLSEDETLTARLLLEEPIQAIVQVGDARNLRRSLMLTAQLAEMRRPLVLALNMMDEAEAEGTAPDVQALSRQLGIPVVPTVAVTGSGVSDLARLLPQVCPPALCLTYPAEVETELTWLEGALPDNPLGPRASGLLWLSAEPAVEEWLGGSVDPPLLAELRRRRRVLQDRFDQPVAEVIQRVRADWVDRLRLAGTEDSPAADGHGGSVLSRLTTHPLWGLAILAGVLLAVYAFVGILGAQILVGWLEGVVFGQIINPWVTQVVTSLAPPLLAEALVGPFGLWTMGVTYAVALILPIVTTFFLAFGVLEDSGYLPRLAVLVHRAFRAIGLNGKAVLPMVLGLGCVTMATVTTRILETRRDRLLAILLLALAIPCSAQLGVVMGMLAGVSFSAMLIWCAVVLLVLMGVGWIAARLVPGQRSTLLVELPPLRLPLISNVVVKTASRLEWYLKEVVPFFVAGAFAVFLLDQAGLLQRLAKLGEPLVTGWLGLPPEAGLAFLMGFLRRDFGATGLFVMQAQGLLSPLQVVVAMVTITLFIPCLAAVMMIARERGWRAAVAMVALIFPLAFLVGGLVRLVLTAAGWSA
ncbi:MAG TPA: ferrous iron transport protein B [Anaerolineales bacterium]|nr:ferrous iron transport protein B [Anaerolineales bacterium]